MRFSELCSGLDVLHLDIARGAFNRGIYKDDAVGFGHWCGDFWQQLVRLDDAHLRTLHHRAELIGDQPAYAIILAHGIAVTDKQLHHVHFIY